LSAGPGGAQAFVDSYEDLIFDTRSTSSRAPTVYRSIETYRGVVYPWSIDHVGHMNVASYTARFDEATWHFLGALGLTPGYLREHGRSAVAADQRTQYKREVLSGSLLHITSELRELGRTSIRFTHTMFDTETNEVVAATELVGVYFDIAARTSVDLPELVREAAKRLEKGK
jgi:acyl-CoA thioester hydrolase